MWDLHFHLFTTRNLSIGKNATLKNFRRTTVFKTKSSADNSRILVGDRPVLFKPLFEAQIIRIKQFLKDDNTFLSRDELTRKMNINIPFTLYYGLVAAIPTEWKKILNQNKLAPCKTPLLKTFRRSV